LLSYERSIDLKNFSVKADVSIFDLSNTGKAGSAEEGRKDLAQCRRKTKPAQKRR